MVISVDVADADAVEAAAAAVESEIGPIDVWVNVAMTSVFAPFLEIEAREFARITEVTYLGFVNGTRAALRRMVPPHWCRSARRWPTVRSRCSRRTAVPARHAGLYRLGPLRAPARTIRCAAVDGASSSHEHAAVRHRACPAWPIGPSRWRRSISPRWRPRLS